MSGPRSATCPDCLSPVRYVVTLAGQQLALNPEPTDNGTVVPVLVDGERLGRVLGGPEMPAQQEAWVQHSKTCTRAARVGAESPPAVQICQKKGCTVELASTLVGIGARHHILCAPLSEFHALYGGRTLRSLAPASTAARIPLQSPARDGSAETRSGAGEMAGEGVSS